MAKKKTYYKVVHQKTWYGGDGDTDEYLVIGEIQVDQYPDNYKSGDYVKVTVEPITKEEYQAWLKGGCKDESQIESRRP